MLTKTRAKDVIALDPETHTYRVNGFVRPGITDILKSVGLIPDYRGDGSAAHRGRAVHLATELLDAGTLDWSSVDDALIPFLNAYENCLKEWNLVPDVREQIVYHPYCFFAGTLDGVYRMSPHGRILVDIKTGDAIPPHAKYQTAAYADAWGSTHGGERLLRGVILLRENGSHDFKTFTDPDDLVIFNSALNVWRAKNG